MLLSPNFCQKSVRVDFHNFHTVTVLYLCVDFTKYIFGERKLLIFPHCEKSTMPLSKTPMKLTLSAQAFCLLKIKCVTANLQYLILFVSGYWRLLNRLYQREYQAKSVCITNRYSVFSQELTDSSTNCRSSIILGTIGATQDFPDFPWYGSLICFYTFQKQTARGQTALTFGKEALISHKNFDNPLWHLEWVQILPEVDAKGSWTYFYWK